MITWELVQMCETHAKCMWFESPDDGIPLALHINTIFSFYCYYDWAIRFPSIEHIICIKTFSIFKILPDNFFKVRARWTILDIVRVCKLAPIASVNEFVATRKCEVFFIFEFLDYGKNKFPFPLLLHFYVNTFHITDCHFRSLFRSQFLQLTFWIIEF